MHYSLKRLTAPVVEPVTLAEARKHLRIEDDVTVEDDMISDWIVAAREACEEETGRCFVSSQWDMRVDTQSEDWGVGPLYLPRSPLISVDGIYYVDEDGVEQTLTSTLYQVDLYSEPGRIVRAFNQLWPTMRSQMDGFRVRFTAGYPAGSPDTAAAENVPRRVKSAMKLMIGHLYANREAVLVGTRAQAVELPQGAKDLLFKLKVEVIG